MHKMNNCNTILANVIGGVSGPDSIASHWKQHFDKLLNVHLHDNSDNFFFGKMIFIVCEQKKSTKKYKQMLYTTYIIIYKIQKYRINNTHHKT